MLDLHGQLIFFGMFSFGKMLKFLEPFFRADMAGLGKYHMGGYGRIGVYRGSGTTLANSQLSGKIPVFLTLLYQCKTVFGIYNSTFLETFY